jgi:hypothetical protein
MLIYAKKKKQISDEGAFGVDCFDCLPALHLVLLLLIWVNFKFGLAFALVLVVFLPLLHCLGFYPGLCLLPKKKKYCANKKFSVTSNLRYMHGVLNVDKIKKKLIVQLGCTLRDERFEPN